MSKPMSERSGRSYPHNAIYEILTYSIPISQRNEPRRYNRRTCNEYSKMMERVNPLTRRAYELVFSNGNTLKEAGRIMKMSATSVARYLKLIYLVRDEYGYCVANLEKVARSSNTNRPPKTNGYPMEAIEKIHWWIEHHSPLTTLSYKDIETILIGYYIDKLKSSTIADFYGFNEEDVTLIIKAFSA